MTVIAEVTKFIPRQSNADDQALAPSAITIPRPRPYITRLDLWVITLILGGMSGATWFNNRAVLTSVMLVTLMATLVAVATGKRHQCGHRAWPWWLVAVATALLTASGCYLLLHATIPSLHFHV
jgi:hypothetical protein